MATAALVLVLNAGSGSAAAPTYASLTAVGTGGYDIHFVGDGSRYFFTTSDALLPADTDSNADVYEDDNGQLTLVSVGATGGNGALDAQIIAISDDGSHVVFSTAEQLTADDTDAYSDLYVWTSSGTALLSKEPSSSFNWSNNGGQFNVAAMTPTGSRIIFDRRDFVFITVIPYFAYANGQVSVVETNTGPSTGPSICGISADGAHVYLRTTTNFDPADADFGGFLGAHYDIYDLSAGQKTLVSTGPSASNAQVDASCGHVTPNGDVFFETSEQLVPEDTDAQSDIYERSGGQTTLVSTGPTGGNGAFDVTPVDFANDGSQVVFSTAEQLVAADTDDRIDLYERSGNQTTLLSLGSAGGNGDFDVFPSLSGTYPDELSAVYFETQEQLVPADVDGDYSVYEWRNGQVVLVPGGPAAVTDSGDAIISTSSRLLPSDTDDQVDLYAWNGSDLAQVSSGNGPFDAVFRASDRAGSHVAFSTAEQLAAEDTDDQPDVYISAPIPPDAASASIAAGGTVATGTTPSAADPIETSVTSPNPGTISITEGPSGSAPTGFHLVGLQAQIDVNVSPAPTAAQPLTIVFALDGSLLTEAGVDAATVQVLKDGVAVPNCSTTTPASPNPCVAQRTPLAGGGAQLTIRTSSASTWTFARRLDSTPPTVTPSVSGTLGTNQWYRSDVSVSWAVVDPESTVSSKTGCDAVVLSTDSAGTTYTCTATSAGGTTTRSVEVKRDATRPSVSFGAHPSSYTVDVTVSISCAASDATSGIGTTCQSVNAPAYTFPVGLDTVSASATDNAGNVANASTLFTVEVTATSLCRLTTNFVHLSTKYAAANTSRRKDVDGTISALCSHLASITPSHRTGPVSAYTGGVSDLLHDGWLTNTQASTLVALVQRL